MSAFLIGIDSEASESWAFGEAGELADVESALGAVGAELVRVWDVPYESSRPWNWLVVSDLPDPRDTYDLLRGAGVEVRGVAPLLLESEHVELDVWTGVLPEKLPPAIADTLYEYVAPGLDDIEMSVGPGVIVWPCCGGIGEHLEECHRR